jgi:hypothetical protein
LTTRAQVREFKEFEPFEPAEREAISLTDITITDFYRDALQAQKTDPAVLDKTLREIHAVFIARIADRTTAQEAILDAQVLRASLPPDLWAKYFSDLPSPRPAPGASKVLFTGAGTIEAPLAKVRLRFIALHCDALRRPNWLSVAWEQNRFDLDLVLRSQCTDAPGTSGVHVQEGTGIGRLNGVPGATIQWRLVDNGARGQDTASITMWSGDGASIVLDRSGKIKGRIQVRGSAGAAPRRAGAGRTPQ